MGVLIIVGAVCREALRSRDMPQAFPKVRFEALAELLGAALTPERFLSEHFDRQSVLLQRTARARPLDDAPLTLDEMDELLVRASLPGSPGELLIFQDLKHVTEYATPHLAYASGASLIINRVDKLWPRVHELCVRLARDFRYAYGNVYLTPPGSQTVPPHSDDHDVFIVQLHGTKHWLVWPAVHPLAQHRPFADEQAGKDGRRLPDDGTSRLTLENLGPPELDVLLRPGDVLYIPRGVVHVAHTGQPGALSTGQSVAISAGQTVAISGDANGGGASAKVPSAVPGASLHLTIAIPTADLSLSSTALNAVRIGARCVERSVSRCDERIGPRCVERSGPHALASALMTSLMASLMASDCPSHQVRAASFGERQFRQALPLGPMPSALPAPPAPPSLAAIGMSTAAAANTDAYAAASTTTLGAHHDAHAAASTTTLGAHHDAHAAASTTTLGAHHDTQLTKSGAHNGASMGVWRQRFEMLWARVHAQVSSQQGVAKAELHRRMRQQRHKQRHAFSLSEAAFAQLVVRSGGGT